MKISLLKDEGLQEICKPFISGLLPHENYDSVVFTDILQSLFSYIRLEEFSGPYYVLLKILDDLNQLKSRFNNYVPKLTKEVLEQTLQVSIEDAIMLPEVDMKYILEYNGLNSDLNIETTKEIACQKLYSMCLDLYDECFEMAVDSNTVIDQVPSLKAAFIGHVSQESINTQALMLQGSVKIGRQVYSGSEDWFEYLKQFSLDLSGRLNKDDVNTEKLGSVEDGLSLLSNLSTFNEVVANYGIPEIDGISGSIGTPMLRHRLVVIIGAVNVGKSMFCIDSAAKALLAKKKVVYMYGESAREKIYAQILISYIKKKYKICVNMQHLVNIEACPSHVQKSINMAIHDLLDLLYLRGSYSYFNLYEELKADYEMYNFDAIFIDHSYALKGLSVKDNGKAAIDAMAIHLREFKRHYPVYVCVASHPSIVARDAMSKNKEIKDSPTKGSSNLYAEADDAFVLKAYDNLEKSGQIALINMKRRDASVITDPIVLQKDFSFYSFIYDEKLQVKSTNVSIEGEEALSELMDTYSDDADNYLLVGE